MPSLQFGNMPSLWGSKKDDDPDSETAATNDGEPSAFQPRPSEDANERTRLLPPPAATGREGFLSPDDPAVCGSFLLLFLLFPPQLPIFYLQSLVSMERYNEGDTSASC